MTYCAAFVTMPSPGKLASAWGELCYRAGSAPRPRLTPLVRLPEKGSSTTTPAPAEATAFEPAFSDEDEEESQPKQSTAAAAVATAEKQSEDPIASSETPADGSAAAVSDNIPGETAACLSSSSVLVPLYMAVHTFCFSLQLVSAKCSSSFHPSLKPYFVFFIKQLSCRNLLPCDEQPWGRMH